MRRGKTGRCTSSPQRAAAQGEARRRLSAALPPPCHSLHMQRSALAAGLPATRSCLPPGVWVHHFRWTFVPPRSARRSLCPRETSPAWQREEGVHRAVVELMEEAAFKGNFLLAIK